MKSVAESTVIQLFTLFLFFLTPVSIYSDVKAQSCTGCSVTVTVPSSANVNISSGQTVCITGTGSYTGSLNMNGGTLCIGQGVNYNPSNANYNSTWTIINNGNFQNVNNLNFNGGTTFINNATGVISFPNNVSFNSTFINNGTANFAQDVTINGGSSVQFGGVTTIGDELEVNGTLTIIGYVQAEEIDINGGGVIRGGNGPGCNYIVATDELDNNGTIGGGSFNLVYSPVPDGNGSILPPAVSSNTLTPPAIQFSGASLSASGNNIVGTVTNPGGSPAPTHYLVLRRVGSPITVAPTDFVNYSVGGTIGGATIVAINPVSTTSFTDANVLSNGCTTYYYAVFGFRRGSGCAEFNNTITNATFVRAFTAIPGPNLTACQSASPTPITLSGASVTNGASSGAWSIISGGGTLSSTAQTSNPATVTYTPAANYSGSVILRLTTNSASGCTAGAANRTIIISQAPTVNAGTSSPVCQSGSPSAITLSGATVGGGVSTAAWSIASGGGTVSSTAQTSNPATVTYTPAANFSGTVTLTLTTASNAGCTAISQNRTITINAASVATPGAALTACQSASPTALTLSGASVGGGATTGAWSITSGGGSLSSSSQTATPGTITYTPAANYSGSVTLILTTNSTAGCPAVTATRTITVSQAPTVTAGTSSPVCQSGSPSAITLSGATVGGGVSTAAWSIASGGGTLSSTAQTSTPATVNYTPAANFSGTVTLTLTTASNAGCTAISQNRTITVNAASIATPGAAISNCQPYNSSTPITLSGASVSGGASTGSWSITTGSGTLSSVSQSATPGQVTYTPPVNFNGTVTLLLTSNNAPGCPTVSSSRTLQINTQPQAPTAVNGAGTFCPGNSATLTVSGGYIPAGSSWQWFTGGCGNTSVGNGTSITVSPTATTTYYVRGAAIGACPATACAPAVMSLPNPVNEIVPVTDNTVCVVRENNYVHFYNLSGQIICSINSRGQDLGNVTASVYVDNTSLNIQPCNAPGFFSTAVMGRRWAIQPQYQPTSAVDVILYFDTNEFTTLRTAANANNNPLDDLSSIIDLTCTKYSNSNASVVNGTWSDNCGGGSSQLVNQSESGNIQTMFSSYSANGRFARYVIGGFSEFWLHGSGTITPLPVRLTTFDAQPNGTEVDITWSTATESNNEKFIIERSADLINWEHVTQTPGAGNSNEVLNYATVDLNPLEGASYYRLTQIDFNGNSETFDPIRVDFTSKPVSASVSVYPNPVVDSYTVQLSADAPGERIISLYTASGSQVSTLRTQVIKGQNKVSAIAQSLAAGVYIIRIENSAESKSESCKLVITRN